MTEDIQIKAIINAVDELTFTQLSEKKPDIIQLDENVYQLLLNNKNFTLTLLEKLNNKSYKVKINGNIYQVDLKDQLDMMVEKLGLSSKAAGKINEIKAPMPGLVIDVLVTPGQTIQKGDSLLILEAMKMENVLKAAGDGVIDQICVSKGDAVEKNHIMITLI
ncbi:MAG TPA: acetyl-CoA carboxylase biotin carboxyl carrier protein subunit [Saprospiraceae bacterium]|nr:acetyl-CoA carboxylase biotin carboxyl carrier protein subunit [Saprospiraceae bacterium]HMV22904.1 acetyl-CoA carboxylase biotin carboxyl carrier protein subunit [Saprospiraceae bacterium]HMW74418.1 acetyl-CoA carboxylase biotin carboxyl carrier protein subunit [Saprospiraceae bacterium]HMX85977.1 acetyl-CoA carboxylase biotin carboxyl carrier protein subunit [Saprospiraceae bacterium]HND15639.1 acetyl-CoA carboxylase biotin carboxyl carrier protein subunit [Saprospiraceae bacterium]